MESCGSVSLEIELGGIISRQSFIMVNNLFPRVFIGIKTMKNIKIEISPNKECITVNRKNLPYISGIQHIRNYSDSGTNHRSFLQWWN